MFICSPDPAHARAITAPFGLFGLPIFASLSPTTSNHAFEQYEDLAKGDNEFTRMEVVNDQNN